MRPSLICTALTCAVALAISSAPVAAKTGGWKDGPRVKAGEARPAVDELRAVAAAKGVEGQALKGGPTCTVGNISCDSFVSGMLQTTDCALDDGTFVDFYVFDGTSGDDVTVNLMSNAFDTFLFLLDPTPEVVAVDDDGGAGTNSRVTFTLDATGEWSIAANNLLPLTGDPGNYTLSLECTDGGGGGPTVPAAPSNLMAATVSSTEIDLDWRDNSGNEDDFQIQIREPGGSFSNLGNVPANSTMANVFDLEADTNYDFRVRARNSAGNSAWSNTASATTDDDGPPPPPGPCIPDATTMCLNEGRFRVQVDWEDFNGQDGQGQVVPFGSDDSGLFFFFSADNWEMLVKVLDGCGINNHFWVFAAATTNVEYTLRVTDTDTGRVSTYTNPLGTASAAITDTSAFPTCP